MGCTLEMHTFVVSTQSFLKTTFVDLLATHVRVSHSSDYLFFCQSLDSFCWDKGEVEKGADIFGKRSHGRTEQWLAFALPNHKPHDQLLAWIQTVQSLEHIHPSTWELNTNCDILWVLDRKNSHRIFYMVNMLLLKLLVVHVHVNNFNSSIAEPCHIDHNIIII